MRIINNGNQKRRTLYAEKLADDEFVLSAVESANAGRRPVARFGTQQQLEQEVNRRGCQVVWQTS